MAVDLLTPQAVGDFVIGAAEPFGLMSPHVIGPDIGTCASLFAAAAHPGRLRSLIIGGDVASYPLALGGLLKECAESPTLRHIATPTPARSLPTP